MVLETSRAGDADGLRPAQHGRCVAHVARVEAAAVRRAEKRGAHGTRYKLDDDANQAAEEATAAGVDETAAAPPPAGAPPAPADGGGDGPPLTPRAPTVTLHLTKAAERRAKAVKRGEQRRVNAMRREHDLQLQRRDAALESIERTTARAHKSRHASIEDAANPRPLPARTFAVRLAERRRLATDAEPLMAAAALFAAEAVAEAAAEAAAEATEAGEVVIALPGRQPSPPEDRITAPAAPPRLSPRAPPGLPTNVGGPRRARSARAKAHTAPLTPSLPARPATRGATPRRTTRRPLLSVDTRRRARRRRGPDNDDRLPPIVAAAPALPPRSPPPAALRMTSPPRVRSPEAGLFGSSARTNFH